jgi:Carboxymuconolactone decarboxylase family
MTDQTPVLDTLADITAASLEHNSLAPREFMLARLAALIAVDAPPASYLANAEAAADSGVTADDIQAVMIAVAPRGGHGAGGLGRREDPQGPGLGDRCGRLRNGRRRRRAIAATRPCQ